jgi:ketosteroid isomerase-like protein
MNGMAIQDETLKHDGSYAGSIRQFIPDSTRWYVHYYSSGSPSTSLPSWEGKKNQDGDIILYREQKAPNGMEGSYKITFTDISEDGFNWIGAWESKDQSVVWPSWKIECTKIRQRSREEDKELLMEANKSFSSAYTAGDYDALAKIYAEDGKIFPAKASIITGRPSIKNRFKVPTGSRILSHEIRPEEINIVGNYAFDYGYYEGKTEHENSNVSTWKGKYVVVWKKISGEWKMYLDIWNPVEE